jgi:hypothetical protein
VVRILAVQISMLQTWNAAMQIPSGNALAARDDRLLWIKVDPRFDNLRAGERYEGLLWLMNLTK